MKIYLDTNMYSFVTERDEITSVQRSLSAGGHEVIISGYHLTEIFRIKDTIKRTREMIGLTTIASPRSYSQVPESYVHAEEVLGELRRLRPQWLSSRPNTSQISVFLNGHRRLWSRVRQDPSYVPETMELMNSSMQSAVPANRDSHRDLRGAIVRAREEHREFELALAHPDFASAVDRYDSLEVAWRLEMASSWTHAIVRRHPAARDHRDWVAPYLRTDRFDPLDWTTF